MATVKKKLPYELYDVAGLEDWFSQMAAEGYHLVDCWENQAEFTVATPMEGVRYRLEAQGKYEYDWQQDEAYKAGGWDHVTTIRGFFCIFRCGDPAAPDLHTDPKIQSWTMRKLLRRRSLVLLVEVIYWGFLSNLNLGLKLGGFEEAVGLLIRNNGLLLVVGATLLFVAHALAVQTVQLVMLWRLKRRLASGLPMDREKRYPRSFWMHGFQWGLLAGVILSVLVGNSLYQRAAVSVDPAGYPHVTLEEVLSGESLASGELSFERESVLERSLLVPVQFRYGNWGYREDGSEEPVRVYLNYFEAVSPGLVKLLLKSNLLDQERGLDAERDWYEKYPDKFSRIVLDTGAVRTPCEGLDELWVWDVQYEDAELLHRHFFGRKGNVAFELLATLPEPDLALNILLEKIPS